MTAAEAKERIKRKFGIPQATTTFDDDIDEAIQAGIEALSPYVHKQSDTPTEFSISSTAQSQDLGTNNDVSRVYIYNTTDTTRRLYTSWNQVNQILFFQETFGVAFTLVVYFNEAFTVATIADIPAAATIPMIDFACSEYASMLAGSTSKFNAYTAASGARAVDSLTDLADWYESRAERRAERIADAEGLL